MDHKWVITAMIGNQMEHEMETGIMQSFLGIRAYRNSGSISGSPYTRECIFGVLI